MQSVTSGGSCDFGVGAGIWTYTLANVRLFMARHILERNIKQFPSNNSVYFDVRPDVRSLSETADE